MKTASYFYSDHFIFNFLKSVLKRKGYTIASGDLNKGAIKAYHKKWLFFKSGNLDVNIEKIDNGTTRVTLLVNSNAHTYDKPNTKDERLEEKLIDLCGSKE